MKRQSPTQKVGQQFEEWACHFLEKQGLFLQERNYQCRCGEIDLIMYDKDILTFIEVRYRKQSTFGTAVDSITLKKQTRIIRAAEYYLRSKRLMDKVPCRFDIVACSDRSVEWIKSAFEIN